MKRKKYRINKLDWDSNKFNLSVYQATLDDELADHEWEDLLADLEPAELVYIKNLSCNRSNSANISKYTNAYLVDTNINLHLLMTNNSASKRELTSNRYDVVVVKDFEWSIDKLLVFSESRFFKDKTIMSIGGASVYQDWVQNSKNIPNKNFIFILDEFTPIGFLLFSVTNKSLIIELLSVLADYQGRGIGIIIIDSLKDIAKTNKVNEIFVGTQVSNINAMNFYLKNGFQIVDSTDIYHWWK